MSTSAHPFSLTIQLPGQGDLKVSGEFTDEEHHRIHSYLDQYEDLCESKPLREGMPCSSTLKWERDSGVTVQSSLPDDDTLSILLHRLRPFVLTDEPASFDRVKGILGRRVENEHIRWLLREQQELYDGREFQQMVRISTHEGVLNSERMLQNWLNSHEYHRDPDKREAVAELLEWLPGDYGRFVFVSMLVDRVRAIGNVASLSAVLIGRTNQLQFQLHARRSANRPDAGSARSDQS